MTSATAPPRRRRLLGVALACAVALPACGGGEPGADAAGVDDRLRVATTVAPITSIAANIGGDRVAITGIVPEGTNSHTFEPRPSVAELLAGVDVVYLNGLVLEEPTKELAEANLREGAEIVELGDRAIDEDEHLYDFSFPEEEGKPNPHLWTDPTYALEYARIIAADLSERDPEGADDYESNLEAFTAVVPPSRCSAPSRWCSPPAATMTETPPPGRRAGRPTTA